MGTSNDPLNLCLLYIQAHPLSSMEGKGNPDEDHLYIFPIPSTDTAPLWKFLVQGVYRKGLRGIYNTGTLVPHPVLERTYGMTSHLQASL